MANAISLQTTPDNFYIGNDGFWKSFLLNIGSSRQAVQVIPSTVLANTWAISPLVCAKSIDPNCQSLRGGFFEPTKSKSWSQYGQTGYSLGISSRYGWNQDEGGLFGTDDLFFQDPKGPVPIINAVVGSMNTNATSVGLFGLHSKPVTFNINGSNVYHNSTLQILKDSNTIPSLSYSYNAGAYYNQTNGFLILGGQDTASYIPNNVHFTFASDQNNSLSVAIQSITSNTNGNVTTLIDGVIQVLIDSTIAEMWLPKSACDAIANIFSLTFSQTNKLYLINDTAHEKNLKNNPSVSIRIADTPTASESVTIHFPYSAFAHPYYDTYDPSYNNKTYFPIRLASDLTQYTLGRVFLQEAVLTVDHERKNFSISQVVNLKGINPQIIDIQSPSASNRNGSDVPTPVPFPLGGGGGISPGAIGGIVVALILLIAGILGLLIWRHRRRNRGGVYGTTQSTNPDTPGPDSGSGPGPMNVPLSLNSTNQKSRAIEIGSLAGHQRPYHKTVLSNTSNGSTTLDVSSDRDRAGSPAPAYAYPNTKTPPAELAEVTILPELPSHRRSSTSFFNSPSLLATPPPIHSPVSELGPSSVGTMEPRYFPEELDQTFTPRSAEIMPLTLTRGASITDVRLTDRSPNIGLGRGSGSNNPTGAQGSTGDGMRATSGPMVLEYEGLGLSLPHSSSPSQS